MVVIDYSVGSVFCHVGCDVKPISAGKLEHLYNAIVEGGADVVLMASSTHFEEYTIKQIKEYLAACSRPVNL